MTLTLPPHLKYKRKRLQDKIYIQRLQLAQAYIAQDTRRIMLAKLTLSRTLKELSESPELGPKRPFKWGVLEVAIRGNLDPYICWEACESTGSDFWHVARLLEGSIVYEMS